MLYHYLVNEFVAKASSKNVKDFYQIPVAIIVFGLTLTLLSLIHYFKNAALRNFAKKVIRHKIDSLRGALRRSVSAKHIYPHSMNLDRALTRQTIPQSQEQNTKFFEKRKRSRHIRKTSNKVDGIVLEDISND